MTHTHHCTLLMASCQLAWCLEESQGRDCSSCPRGSGVNQGCWLVGTGQAWEASSVEGVQGYGYLAQLVQLAEFRKSGQLVHTCLEILCLGCPFIPILRPGQCNGLSE